MNGRYKLVGHEVVTCATPEEWTEWSLQVDPADFRVGETFIGGYRVSTVFLLFARNLFSPGPPQLFESLAFDPNGRATEYSQCSSTWEEALIQHEFVCALVRALVAQIEKKKALVMSTHQGNA